MNADGTVDKYKARLVTKSFNQKKEEDYDQTFSSVAKRRSDEVRPMKSVTFDSVFKPVIDANKTSIKYMTYSKILSSSNSVVLPSTAHVEFHDLEYAE